jgi:hypothetical protein
LPNLKLRWPPGLRREPDRLYAVAYEEVVKEFKTGE